MSNQTKENIVEIALSLIQQKGYTAFSYDDIAKQLNITKAAIHYYFESKEDLGIAVCQRIREKMTNCYEKNLEKIRTNKGTPWDFIEDISEMIKPNQNCPISSLQSDFESVSDNFQQEIKQISELQMQLFLQLVKEFSPTADDNVVTTMFLSIKSALQYRRILGENFFVEAMQSIRGQLECIC